MKTDELSDATKGFDEEFSFLKGRPLTARQKKLHDNARGRGRPRVGRGAQKIQVSLERGLLAKSDSFARKQGMSRSEMIARGLRAVLAAAGEE